MEATMTEQSRSDLLKKRIELIQQIDRNTFDGGRYKISPVTITQVRLSLGGNLSIDDWQKLVDPSADEGTAIGWELGQVLPTPEQKETIRIIWASIVVEGQVDLVTTKEAQTHIAEHYNISMRKTLAGRIGDDRWNAPPVYIRTKPSAHAGRTKGATPSKSGSTISERVLTLSQQLEDMRKEGDVRIDRGFDHLEELLHKLTNAGSEDTDSLLSLLNGLDADGDIQRAMIVELRTYLETAQDDMAALRAQYKGTHDTLVQVNQRASSRAWNVAERAIILGAGTAIGVLGCMAL